jgi:hypothetical protein
MERGEFDALARLIAAQRSRRSALAALLGATLLGPLSELGAAKRKSKQRDQRRREGKGSSGKKANDKAKGNGKNTRRNAKDPTAQPARAEATRCCATGNCVPGKGKNLAKCCYQGQDLTGKNFQGANLGSANFSGATLTGANLQGANAGKACFVGADIRGTRTNGSTNLSGAVFCRTQTDSSENNSGCNKGTPCCPTCDDANPCGDSEICCAGRCIPGNCCGNSEQSTCDDGQICCGNTCVEGECCQAAECPNEICQRRSCQGNQCIYTPVAGEPGPRCQTICCVDAQGDPVCCDAGIESCQSNGRCGCGRDTDCDADQRCCRGTCVPKTVCCEGGNGEGCVGDHHCCVVDGTGVCGACCAANQCADEICATKSCTSDRICQYTPVFGDDGPGCTTICCENANDQPVCCGVGVTACASDRTCPPGCDVCPDGCTYKTLEAAVTGTLANGTVRICPGTYPTNSVTIDKNLTIIGAGSGSDPATDTILSGGNSSGILTIAFGTVTIQDLTVADGKGADRCGGIEVVIEATLNLKRVEVVGNTFNISPTGPNSGGGLIVFAGSTAVVKASRFANNTTLGGASAVGGGIFNGGTLTLETTRVEGNKARGGGGIFNGRVARLTLNQGAVITMNTANDPNLPLGGGIYNLGTITDNDAGTNVFGNIPSPLNGNPNDCVNESPGTGCPA